MFGFSKVTMIICAVLAILTTASGGVAAYYKLQLKAANADLKAVKIREQVATKTIETMREQRAKDIADLAHLRQSMQESRTEMSKAVEELEAYKRNEAQIQKDPDTVERLVNSRVKRLFIALSCASGDTREDCSDTTNEAGASSETGPEPKSSGSGQSEISPIQSGR